MLRSSRLFLISLFTVLLILVVNIAWWLFYQRTEQLLDQQLSRRLTAAASIISASISAERVDSLEIGDIRAIASIAAFLEQVRLTDSLSEVFLLDQQYQYISTTAEETEPRYFLANLNGQYIDSIFFNELPRALATQSYQTGNLYLKSAFAPLFDSRDAVVAVIGVEANVDYFDVLNNLKQNLYYATALSVFGGLLFGFLFFLFQYRLAKAERKLVSEETNAFLGRMVAVVSHEIKNPLAIIRGSAERAAKKQPSTETAFIVEEVDRLNTIVSGYLDFARSGGEMSATEQPEQFDMNQLIAELYKNVEEKYRDHAITWLSQPSGEFVTTGHKRALRQVLLNLLFNGVDACIDANKPIKVGVTAKRTDVNIIITVVDEGSGILEKDRRGLFEPFYTTKQSGSGLGLFISRKIVEGMQGTLDITSTVDSGTTVTITLPEKR